MHPAFHYTLLSLGVLFTPVIRADSSHETTTPSAAGNPDAIFLRVGTSATKTDRRFREALLTGVWDFPLLDESGASGWRVTPRLEVSLGALTNPDDTALVAAFGPALRLGHRDFPVFLEGSFCPTLLSDDTFGPVNFGTNVQFTSAIGLTWQVSPRCAIGYQFQHMSNASLSENNPGLELHMLACGFRF